MDLIKLRFLQYSKSTINLIPVHFFIIFTINPISVYSMSKVSISKCN